MLLALGSLFVLVCLLIKGDPKQISEFFGHLNHVSSDFGTSQIRRMFLIKTPSQQFSSSKQATSRRWLEQGESRARGLVMGREQVVSDGEHSSCFVLIVLRLSALPASFLE
jgi:hypothetical protein